MAAQKIQMSLTFSGTLKVDRVRNWPRWIQFISSNYAQVTVMVSGCENSFRRHTLNCNLKLVFFSTSHFSKYTVQVYVNLSESSHYIDIQLLFLLMEITLGVCNCSNGRWFTDSNYRAVMLLALVCSCSLKLLNKLSPPKKVTWESQLVSDPQRNWWLLVQCW